MSLTVRSSALGRAFGSGTEHAVEAPQIRTKTPFSLGFIALQIVGEVEWTGSARCGRLWFPAPPVAVSLRFETP